jgi:hypothetical protein
MNRVYEDLVKSAASKGLNRQQIWDEYFDSDDPIGVVFCRKLMAAYDRLYPSPPILPAKAEPISWRFGQFETYTKWQQKLTLERYWGAIIAPTGWGKSFMTMVMIGIYLLINPGKNILYITKRKDVLESQFGSNSDFKSGLAKLAALGMFPAESISKVWNMFNQGEFMRFKRNHESTSSTQCFGSVFIFNIDKLTADGQVLNWLLNQPGINIGALIFDEMHWTGAEGISDSIKLIKAEVPYGIGFSATPVRIMPDNQRRTFELFGNGLELEILHEVTYTEAWQHKIILPVKHFYFPIEHNDLTAETNLVPNSAASPSRLTQEPGTGITYKISESGHRKLLLAVSSGIWQSELVYRKGIMYFESRQRLVDFYAKIRIGLFADIPIISDCLAISSGSGGIHMSFSFQTSTDTVLLSRLAGLGIQPTQIQSGIKNFKAAKQRALLLVVGQAVEGFDDFRNELVFEMDYAASRNPLTTLQKIGRAQRIQPSEELLAGARPKTTGYYICPVSKKSNKLELCRHIAGLTKDYLAAVGADILDDAEDPAQLHAGSILLEDPNLIQQLEPQQQRIKQIIQQNLYLADGYEITTDDILSEIHALGYRAISTAKRLAKFCREYGINSKDEYTQFRAANANRFDLRPSAADYPGFGWQQVIDPNRTNYYPTRVACLARMKEVDAEFTIANRLNPSANKHLTSARKYNIIKFYNHMDPRIPLMLLDEFYGVERNK